MTKTFTITPQDVQELEKNATSCLTSDCMVISLLALFCDQRDFETWENNNIERRLDNEKEILDNLDYEASFLRALSKEKKLFYVDNVAKFDDDLAKYQEATREKLCSWDTIEAWIQKEYDNNMEKLSEETYKEYLSGDYHNTWVIQGIKKELDKKGYGFEYDIKSDIATITRDDDDFVNKQRFLNMAHNHIIARKEEAKEKNAKRKQELIEQEKRKQEHIARTMEKQKERILNSITE